VAELAKSMADFDLFFFAFVLSFFGGRMVEFGG